MIQAPQASGEFKSIEVKTFNESVWPIKASEEIVGPFSDVAEHGARSGTGYIQEPVPLNQMRPLLVCGCDGLHNY